MVERLLTLAEAQQQLLQLHEQIAQETITLIVTHQDVPVLTILSFDMYKKMQEALEDQAKTLEILHDEKFMAAFRHIVQDTSATSLHSLDETRKELDQNKDD